MADQREAGRVAPAPEEAREGLPPKERLFGILMQSSAFREAAVQAVLNPVTKKSDPQNANIITIANPVLHFSVDSVPYEYWILRGGVKVTEVGSSKEEKNTLDFQADGAISYIEWNPEHTDYSWFIQYPHKKPVEKHKKVGEKIREFIDKLEERVQADEARRAGS